MAALGLLITRHDELVNRASGRECDTVVDFSELFSGEIKNDVDASWNRIQVIADSITALRAMLPQLAALRCQSKVFDVTVGGLPSRGLLELPRGSVGIRAVVSAQRLVVEEAPAHARLTVRFRGLLVLSDVLAAMLTGGPSRFQRPAGGLRLGVDRDVPEAMPWACGDPAAIRVDLSAPADDGDAPGQVDLVLTGPRGADVAGGPAALVVTGPDRRPAWRELVGTSRDVLEGFASRAGQGDLLPPVDTDTLRPVGFLGDVSAEEVQLDRIGGDDVRRFVLTGSTGWSSSVFDDWSGLSERVVDEARGFRAVHDDPGAHRGPIEQASFLVQAACAALPVVVPDLSRTVARLVGEPLAEVLSKVTPADLADRVRREAYCMSLRRLAFGRHGTRASWRTVAEDLGAWTRPGLTVSVVLPTKRPGLLPRIAEQVGRQDWPGVELVLGLHGFGRDHPRVREFEATYEGALVLAEIPAERSLGDMLNDLTATASGELIAKMDDDDWYSRHHLTDLVQAAEFSRADLVGSGAEFVYLEALDVTVRRHRSSGHRYANRVPGATLLIARDALTAVGGWRPIHRGVDTALARAVTEAGGSMYRTHGLGIVVYRAAKGHTWDPGAEYFLRGDVDQWPGFAPPPGIVGAPPAVAAVPRSWFEGVRNPG